MSTITVIDDHERLRLSLRALLEVSGFAVLDFPSGFAFLEADMPGDCLLVDVRMPVMSGLELQLELVRREKKIPLIVMTGHGEVGMAVQAMRAGAYDFLEKPFDDEVLLAAIRRALEDGARLRDVEADARFARDLIGMLTDRERDVLRHLVQGKSNKLIAHDLGISPRTVEIHRARLQDKMQARDLSDLVRAVHAAERVH